MTKLPILVGAVLAIAFTNASAQTHGYTHDGHRRAPAPGPVHIMPAVAVVQNSHPSYGYGPGPGLRESHGKPRHDSEHRRREFDRGRHGTVYGDRGH